MACIFLCSFTVRDHDSQAYREMDVIKDRVSRILERREMFLSFETGFNLVNAAVGCAVLEKNVRHRSPGTNLCAYLHRFRTNTKEEAFPCSLQSWTVNRTLIDELCYAHHGWPGVKYDLSAISRSDCGYMHNAFVAQPHGSASRLSETGWLCISPFLTVVSRLHKKAFSLHLLCVLICFVFGCFCFQ